VFRREFHAPTGRHARAAGTRCAALVHARPFTTSNGPGSTAEPGPWGGAARAAYAAVCPGCGCATGVGGRGSTVGPKADSSAMM
jgi:hypothetical protein